MSKKLILAMALSLVLVSGALSALRQIAASILAAGACPLFAASIAAQTRTREI